MPATASTPDSVQSIDFLLAANAAGDDQLARCEPAQSFRGGNGKALHQAFAIDVRVEKCRDVGLELRDGLVGRERDLRLPSLHGDAAILGIDAGDMCSRPTASPSSAAKCSVHARCPRARKTAPSR